MITMNWLQGPGGYEQTKGMRHEVFVLEQGCSPDTERDALDAHCEHLLVYDGGEPVATGRLARLESETFLGRVAVRKAWRGLGLGDFTVRLLLDRALQRFPHGDIVIHAQSRARAFYERYGFSAENGRYSEEGIEHVTMRIAPENVVLSHCKNV